MKPHYLTGATFAVLAMTAAPVWAMCHDTSDIAAPESTAMAEPSTDVETDSDRSREDQLLADLVPVEDLERQQALMGNEDPEPAGYITSVPADKIEDDADVGVTTARTTEEEAEDRTAAETPPSVERKTKPMKVSVAENGEYAELAPYEEQVSMARAERTTEKVKELVESMTPGQDGVSDPEEDREPDFVALETDTAARHKSNLEIDCPEPDEG